MEATRQINKSTRTPITQGWPSNDNRHKPLSMGRSVFPNDAVARIYKPSRAVTTSGMARTRGWRLVFERRTAPFIETLMGYTGGDDTLSQVELSFPTLESAIRYAERQGLTYVVQMPTRQSLPSGGAHSHSRSKKIRPIEASPVPSRFRAGNNTPAPRSVAAHC